MQSSHYSFLCACLRSDGAIAHGLAQSSAWNWGCVFEEANRNAVLPTLGVALQHRIHIPLPQDVTEFLSSVVIMNRERNESIWAELAVVVALLNRIGIEPVLLKGAAYQALGIYPNLGERYLVDVDLLISEEDLDTAVALLIGNGFVRDDSDRFGRFRHHHPPLRRPGSVSIEIHHTLVTGRSASLLPAHEVIAQSVPCVFAGTRARVPCPEHLMTHLILHSQLLHPYNERIWPGLRALNDLVRLQNRFASGLDWAAIRNRFRKAGYYGLLALHLKDVQDALGLNLREPIRLSRLTRLCWYRRRLLRRWPGLRYLDPVYMFSTVCTRRLRILMRALSTPGEWKYFASLAFDPQVYRRFLTDVLEGRGRS